MRTITVLFTVSSTEGLTAAVFELLLVAQGISTEVAIFIIKFVLKTGLHQKALPLQGCFPKVQTTYMTSYIDYNKHAHDYIDIQKIEGKKLTKS